MLPVLDTPSRELIRPLPVAVSTSHYYMLVPFLIWFQRFHNPTRLSNLLLPWLLRAMSRWVRAVPQDLDPTQPGAREVPVIWGSAASSCPVEIFSCCSCSHWLMSFWFGLLKKVCLCLLCHLPFRIWKMQIDPHFSIPHLFFHLLSFQFIPSPFPWIWFQTC